MLKEKKTINSLFQNNSSITNFNFLEEQQFKYLFKVTTGEHGLYQQTSPFPLSLSVFFNLYVELTLEHPQEAVSAHY